MRRPARERREGALEGARAEALAGETEPRPGRRAGDEAPPVPRAREACSGADAGIAESERALGGDGVASSRFRRDSVSPGQAAPLRSVDNSASLLFSKRFWSIAWVIVAEYRLPVRT